MRCVALLKPPVWGTVLVALLSVPALAGEALSSGDGSSTNNLDLLQDQGRACAGCFVPYVPPESDSPFFDIDWQLALRGGYAVSTTGNSFVGSVLPAISLKHDGLRSSFGLTANAELTQSTIDPFRIASAALAANGDYELDEATTLTGAANVTLSQDQPNLPATLASPQILSSDAQVAIERRLGHFDATARLEAGRDIYGPSVGAGGVTIDNSWDNNTAVGGGARLAYPITPLLAAFVDGAVRYQYFDGQSPVALAKLDGPTYTGKIGLTYELNSTLSAEASVGVGRRQFVAGFPDVTATLYNAKVTFRPDETLVLDGAFTTDITPPVSSDPGLARVKYTATADAAYTVNSWLGLRATADWYRADIVGSPDAETGYDLGLGADYLLNEHTTLTADYTFNHNQAPAPPTAVDTHKFMVGVTFKK